MLADKLATVESLIKILEMGVIDARKLEYDLSPQYYKDLKAFRKLRDKLKSDNATT